MSMLIDNQMIPTIPVSDLARARAWYQGKLGLTPVNEVPGQALAYRTPAGQSLLLFISDDAGAVEHQLAAWRVDDVAAEVTELRGRGVRFEEYDEPDVRTVDGIAATPVGRAAWFKDSEGNVLTISQLG
jgi:catechol 2,3-dioxygenase-like lactoylglutathione lyase family enzyme